MKNMTITKLNISVKATVLQVIEMFPILWRDKRAQLIGSLHSLNLLIFTLFFLLTVLLRSSFHLSHSSWLSCIFNYTNRGNELQSQYLSLNESYECFVFPFNSFLHNIVHLSMILAFINRVEELPA